MTTKEICASLGITEKALRLYESKGLLSARRGENGYRDYSLNDLTRLRAIMMLRELSFSIAEIKEILKRDEIGDDVLSNVYLQYKLLSAQIAKSRDIKYRITQLINTLMEEEKEERDISELLMESMEKGKRMSSYVWDFDTVPEEHLESILCVDEEYNAALEVLRRHILKRETDGIQIVDAGVGMGLLWKGMPSDFNVTFFDRSLVMLQNAKKVYPQAELKLGDILAGEDLPGKYDLVVASFLIHHIPYEDHLAAFHNVLDLVKTGGEWLYADRNVWNEKGKEELLEHYHSIGNQSKLNELNTEYYVYADRLCRYLELHNFSYEIIHESREVIVLSVKV